MDPTNQRPPEQPAPDWSTPQPPQQPPAWGAPQPPAQQPPAQQPPAWGTPPAPQQPGWGAPQPPQPGWGYAAPAPVPPKSHRLRNIILGVVGVVVLGFAALVVVAVLNNPAGKVMFSKSIYDTSRSSCTFPDPITTASTTDSIYVLAALKDTITATDSLTMEVFKDGVSQGTQEMGQGTEVNCLWIKNNMGPLDAGTWRVTFTHNGKIEAEGTITVK